MPSNLAKTYDPKSFEDRIYADWEEKGAFRAEIDEEKEPYTIVMPPPNITGQLHMGHALDQTLQDVLTRFKRMQGYCALWLPGTDHASIATEVKVVEKLYEDEGKTKEEIGREEFLKRAWAWKTEYGDLIKEQVRKLGNSCDWSRERFTMDEGCSRAVVEHFVRLYEKDLIYRGHRIINWCPVCGSALSDIEVEHRDIDGKYWYFLYPFPEGGGGITIATSRPETMFADVAIAVHPSDGRYKDMIGRTVLLPIVNKEIPIIADEYPDPEKGSGAVKVTPAHDANDFEIGLRHGLPQPVCIDLDARMTSLAGKYEGMDRYECRRQWVKDLEEAGYLVKVEDVIIPVGECYRCATVVEPAISEQWFVKMKPLAEPAMEAARKKELIHVPERFEKIYMHWLSEIKDWCISRQLWWGHRIPAYYCTECDCTAVAREKPEACPECGGAVVQDEDVLDTWFSSALWPFSTLGWPEKTEDLDYFYPTSVLVTGYDIIFFWVARMVFAGLEEMGEVPFRHVLVHGLVRDSEGRKMSKSLGNGIDPLEMIDIYGADALRFMLISGTSPGNDMRFQTEKIESARNFANKLWNASRFVIMNLRGEDGEFLPMTGRGEGELRDEDRWIEAAINSATREITQNMERFELSLAAGKIYELTWNEFCDWYIELVKSRLYGACEEEKKVVRRVLTDSLITILRLLHPFMPFITEEIRSFLPRTEEDPEFLMLEPWPSFTDGDIHAEAAGRMELAMGIIREIRNIRAKTDAKPSVKLNAFLLAKGKEDDIKEVSSHIKNLAGLAGISFIGDKSEIPGETASAALPGVEIFVLLDELIDYDTEFARLSGEEEKLTEQAERIRKKLSNENFTSKAPEQVVAAERAKLKDSEDMLEKLRERLSVVRQKLS